ncbi:MAG: RecX family transcriptional regulator [Candidatus Cloacimonetes bacterium]|nr:RecX family transcriptional regulator [Candidatus Cloacimonadota bacterium]
MKIKTLRRTKTTSIVVANEEYWGILPDKILHFYSKGQSEQFEISIENAEKLLDDIKKTAWEKLLDFLAYRERSYSECESFLMQRILFKKDLQNKMLQKAISLNFINDERFAEMLTDDLIRKGKSEAVIRNKLYSKNIREDIISKVIIEKYDGKTKNEILQANIKKAKKKYGGSQKANEKILNFLTRQGFSYWEVKEIMGD